MFMLIVCALAYILLTMEEISMKSELKARGFEEA